MVFARILLNEKEENRCTRRKTLGVRLSEMTETQPTYDLEARVEPVGGTVATSFPRLFSAESRKGPPHWRIALGTRLALLTKILFIEHAQNRMLAPFSLICLQVRLSFKHYVDSSHLGKTES